jgi:hypothetical protein
MPLAMDFGARHAHRGRATDHSNPSSTMTPVSPTDAARVFRDAVAALSERLSSDYGELVPDASAERTAALLGKLESGAAGAATTRGIRLADDHVATLDAWIRLADNAVLHDDTREGAARSRIADDLRAIRALSAPRFDRLLEDDRETELGA